MTHSAAFAVLSADWSLALRILGSAGAILACGAGLYLAWRLFRKLLALIERGTR